jgi:hypothetical protein
MKPLVKVPLKYGVIAGLLGTALLIGVYYMGRHPFLIPVYADYRVMLLGVFVFFTLKEIRDFHQGGELYFSQGVVSAFILVAAFALIASVGVGIFAAFNEGFLSEYIKESMVLLKSMPDDVVQKIGKDTYQRNLELLPSTNGFDLAKLYFVQSFIIGFFVSIILSVILRRQPKT